MKEKVIKIMLGWVENHEPIETTADKLLDLFVVSGQSEQLKAFADFLKSEYHLPVSNRMIDEFKQK